MYILQEQTSIEIKDLQPNSMYFLQVQSISQFGLGKLRSEKSEIFYNTTSADATVTNQRIGKLFNVTDFDVVVDI